MDKLTLVKSENFGQVQCDFWQNEKNEILMTINQLAQALDYSDRSGVQKIVDRNSYLKSREFSVQDRLSSTDGKSYNTRIFTEDGIYEVTMLAGTEKAKEFRAWVRNVLKALRKGQAKLVTTTEEKKKLAEARLKNANAREANILLKIADKPEINKQYKQVLYSYASQIVSGQMLLPLPESEKTYSAQDIADELGISANMVGRLANKHNIKIEEYGGYYMDKSPYSTKQVDTWRYNENGKRKLTEIVQEI